MTMTFNGVSKPFVHATVDTKRPMWAPVEWEMVEIPGRPGAYLKQKKIKARPLPVDVVIKDVDDLQKAKEEVADWLVTDNPGPLIFPDEPDRTYYAMIDGEGQLDEVFKFGKGTINFICPDPYKHGAKVVFNVSNTAGAVTDIKHNGSASTSPVVNCTFAGAATTYSIELLNDDGSVFQGVYVKFNFIAGDKLTIDFAKRAAFVNGAKKNSAVLIKSDFFDIPKKNAKVKASSPSELRFTEKYK
ncbi:distal tail protein Dit [Bacillus subtilis]|uniref:Distal tail protein Dit n=1 Tax=Bacillus subtilis TaxID=1423 RepID=A0AAX3RMU4_BACIU|nr:phage tail family protein [Bacillus subtilis]